MTTPKLFLTCVLARISSLLRPTSLPSLALPGLLLLSLGLVPTASHTIITFGGSLTDFVHEVSVDATGNTYMLGNFEGMVDFDPGPAAVAKTAAFSDLFVASYTADSALRFVFTIEGKSAFNDWIEGSAITLGKAGDIYITGRFEGTIDFDPGPGTEERTSNGFSDAFVARYSPAGSLVWVLSFGTSQGDTGDDIVVDDAGNVYVTGTVLSIAGDTVDFDPGPGVVEHTPDGIDTYLVSYDADGDFRFVTTLGGPGLNDVYGTNLAFGDAGEIYLAGYFDGVIDFDPGPGTEGRTSNGQFDAFVARYSTTDGQFQSVFTFGGELDDFVNQLTRTDAGVLHVSGRFDGTADFDPGPGTVTRTGVGSYLASYAADGTLRFVHAWEIWSPDHAVDWAGNSYLTGYFSDRVDFDPGAGTEEHTPVGDTAFLASYNANGDFLSVVVFEGGPSEGRSIVLDDAGNGYLSGTFQKTVDFDPGEGVDERTANGFDDIFLVSFPEIGEPAPELPPLAGQLYVPIIKHTEETRD